MDDVDGSKENLHYSTPCYNGGKYIKNKAKYSTYLGAEARNLPSHIPCLVNGTAD